MNLRVLRKPPYPNLPSIKRGKGEGKAGEAGGRTPKESREKQKRKQQALLLVLRQSSREPSLSPSLSPSLLRTQPLSKPPQRQAAFCDIIFPPSTFDLHPRDLELRWTSKAEEGRVLLSEPHCTRDRWRGSQGMRDRPGPQRTLTGMSGWVQRYFLLELHSLCQEKGVSASSQLVADT